MKSFIKFAARDTYSYRCASQSKQWASIGSVYL